MALASPDAPPGLRVFSDPSSIAVIGASDNPAKWGFWLASGALDSLGRRAVYLVNRSTSTALGTRCLPDLAALPQPPELVVLCVPAAQVPDVVDQGLAMGVRGFLGITAGIGDEAALAQHIRSGGARLLGANSLGLWDADSHLRLAWGHFTPGPLAVVSQSGQLGSELAIRCGRSGIGISRFVSTGNQSDITANELLIDLAQHESTKIIALYLESFGPGVNVFETLRMLRSTGKPTILLTVGGSPASTRLARSHTGSLTSATEMVDAACRAAGVLRVRHPDELVDVALGYLTVRTPTARRVAVAGDSGGQCGVAADVATAEGLSVPALATPTTAALQGYLPVGAAHQNPVDLAGAGEADLTTYARVTDSMLADDGVDTLLLTGYFGRYGTDTPQLLDAELQVAERLGIIARTHGKSIIVHTMAPDSDTADALWSHGVPAVGSVEEAVRMIRGLGVLDTPPREIPPVRAAPRTPVHPGYWAARSLVGEVGVAMPAARRVATIADVTEAAAVLAAPYVLKAGWIEHKSELDAVILGLPDRSALERAFEQMRDRLGHGEYIVESQDIRTSCVEMIVGARRDPALGPVVVVGMGGTEAELWHDIAIECAPVSADTAAGMIRGLRCAPLLRGWRGRPSVDVEALGSLVVNVSHLIASRPDIAEVELNPVRIAAQGALAVDVLLIPTESPEIDPDIPDDSTSEKDTT